MIYRETSVAGAMIIDLEPHSDARGFFARVFDHEEFVARGLDLSVAQANMSFNHAAGTLRGLHVQVPPFSEAKLVRCTQGAIVDVAVDVRPDSPTYGEHVMVELTPDNRTALFIPAYVAHGFQTLVADTEVTYQVGGRYAPQGETGYRHDDPEFGIEWPLPVSAISDKDAAWPFVSDREVARA